MFKNFLLISLFISSLFSIENKPSNNVLEYRIQQLEKNIATLEVANENHIKNKFQLEKEIEILKNKNNEEKENYKNLLVNNESIYSNQLTAFNLILFLVGTILVIISILGWKEISKKINEKIEEKIKNDSDNAIKDAKQKLELMHETISELDKRLTLTLEKDPSKQTDLDKKIIDIVSKELEMKKDKNYEDWFLLGLEHQKNNQLSLAIEAYNNSIKLNNNLNSHFNKALAYTELKEYQNSINSYNDALLLEENDVEIYNNLAVNYIRCKEYDKALENLYKAKNLDDKFELVYTNLITTFNQKKEFDTALEIYNQAQNIIDIKHENTFKAIADTFTYKENFQKAIHFLSKVLDINPLDAPALTRLGYCYGKTKEYDKAFDAYIKSHEIDNNDYISFLNLVEIKLFNNRNIPSNLIKNFMVKFNNNSETLIKYEMLDILTKTLYNNSYNYHNEILAWQKKYNNTPLSWNFEEIDTFSHTSPSNRKEQFITAVQIFKDHQNKFRI